MPTPAITELPEDGSFEADLQLAGEGNVEAQRRLWEKYYPVFRECAKTWRERRWSKDISLDGTDIVNMVYARMHARIRAMSNGRAYFFRAFYEECLRVVLDHWRKTRDDRGRGALGRVEMPENMVANRTFAATPERLHDLIDELQGLGPRMTLIAKLKVFGEAAISGQDQSRPLSNQEVADLVGYSLRIVEQDWSFAKAHIYRRLEEPTP